VGCVFLAASVSKLADMALFRRTLASYAVLPSSLVAAVAPALAITEGLVALAFLVSYQVQTAAALAGAMLIAFFGGVAINLRRGRKIECGCFGSKSDTISVLSLARLVLLSLPLLVLLLSGPSRIGVMTLLDLSTSALVDVAEAVALMASLLICGAWLLALPEAALVMNPPSRMSSRKERRSE
jgi:hypothetical protein